MFQNVRSGDRQSIGTACEAWTEPTDDPGRNCSGEQFVRCERTESVSGGSTASVRRAGQGREVTASVNVTPDAGGAPSRSMRSEDGIDDSNGVVTGCIATGSAVGWSQ